MGKKEFDKGYKEGAETTIRMVEEWTESYRLINDMSSAASVAIFNICRQLRKKLKNALDSPKN